MASCDDKFFVEPNMILTSSAQEMLRNRGVAIHYGLKPSTGCGQPYDDTNSLNQTIIDIIEKEYKIKDQSVVKLLADRIIKRL